MDEFRTRVFEAGYHVMAITESWASERILDAELMIDGYNMYRRDRGSDIRGGESFCTCRKI